MPRLRIRRTTWPRPALILTDTPRPTCPHCQGEGGRSYDYGDYETGEYAGTEWDPCTCWNEEQRWTVLPLPRLPHGSRTTADPWATSDWHPF
ncbi:hypothetical protein ACFCYC_25470 [Streptomyces sp. NPDC056402]|uniref:hypothetical protein n=1 Tax=Streptomyces sp. NPDC056402 TaxID=3345810 RepID=UPI0035DF8A35